MPHAAHRRPNGIDLPFASEITPQEIFESRRSFIKQIAMGAAGAGSLLQCRPVARPGPQAGDGQETGGQGPILLMS